MLSVVQNKGINRINLDFLLQQLSKHDGIFSYNIRCIMLPHVVSCCLMLYHVASCCIMLPHVVSCCLMLYHVASCCIMLPHVVSCCLMLYHVASCCLMKRPSQTHVCKHVVMLTSMCSFSTHAMLRWTNGVLVNIVVCNRNYEIN